MRTGSAAAQAYAEFGDLDEIRKKWQGAWLVVDTRAHRSHLALQVKGSTVDLFYGDQQLTGELRLVAPCHAVIEREGGVTSFDFVFDGDTLYSGEAGVGIKKGDKILACERGIYLWDGKTCIGRELVMGDWSSKPTECKLDGSTFTAKGEPPSDDLHTFEVVGDILLSTMVKDFKVERAASFAAAKATFAAGK